MSVSGSGLTTPQKRGMDQLAFLVRNIVGDLEQVAVPQGHTHVLGLATGETTRQVRVAVDASRPPGVHGLHRRVGVGLLALRRQLLLAEKALGKKRVSMASGELGGLGDLGGSHLRTKSGTTPHSAFQP